jgi:hypothetical protein
MPVSTELQTAAGHRGATARARGYELFRTVTASSSRWSFNSIVAALCSTLRRHHSITSSATASPRPSQSSLPRSTTASCYSTTFRSRTMMRSGAPVGPPQDGLRAPVSPAVVFVVGDSVDSNVAHHVVARLPSNVVGLARGTVGHRLGRGSATKGRWSTGWKGAALGRGRSTGTGRGRWSASHRGGEIRFHWRLCHVGGPVGVWWPQRLGGPGGGGVARVITKFTRPEGAWRALSRKYVPTLLRSYRC